MKRSGRANTDDVPAFFTRSKAKHFFNSSPNGTNPSAAKCRDGKQQSDEELEQTVDQKPVLQTENKNPQIPEEEMEVNQTQDTHLKLKDSNDMETHDCELLDNSEDSMKDSQPTQVKQENELVKAEPVDQSSKNENLRSPGQHRKGVSATTKALDQLKQAIPFKKNGKKKQKISLTLRRRKLNNRLNRLLMPKSGLMFLHELKPGCTFKIKEKPDSNPPVFLVEVHHGNKIIAVGQGMTKMTAKNVAAENAIKVLVAETMSAKTKENANGVNNNECPTNNSSTSGGEPMDISDDLSLAGLASFAMYKMFTEWQSHGYDFSSLCVQQKKRLVSTKTLPTKKELPPNAENLHPSFLLNTMVPGAVSVELERSSKDNVSFVTVGYEIDGNLYKGTGSNKKEARKQAAKAVLSSLFGLKYDDE